MSVLQYVARNTDGVIWRQWACNLCSSLTNKARVETPFTEFVAVNFYAITIDDPDISLSVVRVDCTETTEWIDILFGIEISGYPRNRVLDEVSICLQLRGRGFSAAFGRLLCLLLLSSFWPFYEIQTIVTNVRGVCLFVCHK